MNNSNNYLGQLARRVLDLEASQAAYVHNVALRITQEPRRYICERTPCGQFVNLRPDPGQRDALTEGEEMVLAYYRSRLARARRVLYEAQRAEVRAQRIALEKEALDKEFPAV